MALLDKLCDKCLKQPRNAPKPANTLEGVPSPALLCGSCLMELQMWQSWFARGGLDMNVSQSEILLTEKPERPETNAKGATAPKPQA